MVCKSSFYHVLNAHDSIAKTRVAHMNSIDFIDFTVVKMKFDIKPQFRYTSGVEIAIRTELDCHEDRKGIAYADTV